MKGPTKNQMSSLIGWPHVYVWKMSLWRTKSSIISWDGSIHHKRECKLLLRGAKSAISCLYGDGILSWEHKCSWCCYRPCAGAYRKQRAASIAHVSDGVWYCAETWCSVGISGCHSDQSLCSLVEVAVRALGDGSPVCACREDWWVVIGISDLDSQGQGWTELGWESLTHNHL